MARKFYKTPVIRYRGFGFRERRTPRGGYSAHKPAGLKLCTAHRCGFVCYPWILGSFAYGPNVVALGPIDRQGQGLLDVAFFKCEVHGDTESPMHPSALLWSLHAMFGQVAIRSLGVVSFKATKIIDKPISDKAR